MSHSQADTGDKSFGRKRLFEFNSQDLKRITVSVKRKDVPEDVVAGPLMRSLNNLQDLVLHKPGEGDKPIFERQDVVVNIEEEERIIVPTCDLHKYLSSETLEILEEEKQTNCTKNDERSQLTNTKYPSPSRSTSTDRFTEECLIAPITRERKTGCSKTDLKRPSRLTSTPTAVDEFIEECLSSPVSEVKQTDYPNSSNRVNLISSSSSSSRSTSTESEERQIDCLENEDKTSQSANTTFSDNNEQRTCYISVQYLGNKGNSSLHSRFEKHMSNTEKKRDVTKRDLSKSKHRQKVYPRDKEYSRYHKSPQRKDHRNLYELNKRHNRTTSTQSHVYRYKRSRSPQNGDYRYHKRSRSPRSSDYRYHERSRSPRSSDYRHHKRSRSPQNSDYRYHERSRSPRSSDYRYHERSRSPRSSDYRHHKRCRSPRGRDDRIHERSRSPRRRDIYRTYDYYNHYYIHHRDHRNSPPRRDGVFNYREYYRRSRSPYFQGRYRPSYRRERARCRSFSPKYVHDEHYPHNMPLVIPGAYVEALPSRFSDYNPMVRSDVASGQMRAYTSSQRM